MSFSSFRIREDSCSGVGALSEREPVFSAPEGGSREALAEEVQHAALLTPLQALWEQRTVKQDG